MISTVPEAVIQQPSNIRDFPDSIYNEILFTLHSPLHRFPVPLIACNLYTQVSYGDTVSNQFDTITAHHTIQNFYSIHAL